MDKQEATEFILQALANNQSPSEIASQLAGELKAPREFVERFVLQVAAQHAAAEPPAPEAEAAPAVEPATAQEADVEPAAELASDTEAAVVAAADLAPGLEAEEAPLQTTGFQEDEETSFPALPVAHTPAADPDAQPAEADGAQANDLLDDKDLVKVVLRSLNKGDNRDDIITMVCERTNAAWPQAQRMVAQVEVDHYQGLSFKRNLPLLLGSIVIGVLGIAVMLFGVLAAAPYLSTITGETGSVPQNLINSSIGPDDALFLALVGVGMSAVGGLGIFRALQDHL